MLTKHIKEKRDQIQMFLMEDAVPQNQGRPSIEPVMLIKIKIPLIQYLFGIRSMRQTIKEIEVNVAYRWFLGLEMLDPVPHFSTFGKNYTRRFKDTALFEQIFAKILEECYRWDFVDATHIKACANRRKAIKKAAK